MTLAALRAQFPILERVAYLNAGTDGPVPRAAQEAVAGELASELEEGRAHAHFERRFELQDELRAGYAELLGCTPDDIALTTSTSEGLGKVLAGMDIGPGDEIVTSDEEHPGLIGPLIAARERGAEIRAVPFAAARRRRRAAHDGRRVLARELAHRARSRPRRSPRSTCR